MIFIYPNTLSTFHGDRNIALSAGYVEIADDIYADLVEGKKKWSNNKIVNNPDYAERWVSASWDADSNEKRSLFEANLQIRVDDRIGMLADISVALADMRVDILQINVQTSSGGSLVTLKVGCKNTDHYNSIVSRLRSIPGVYDVSRGFVN